MPCAAREPVEQPVLRVVSPRVGLEEAGTAVARKAAKPQPFVWYAAEPVFRAKVARVGAKVRRTLDEAELAHRVLG